MKKVEIKIPGDNTAWGTIKTKYPADSEFVGNNELTGDSRNFDTSVKGIVTKRKDEILYNLVDFTYPPKDQYEAIFVDGVRHLLIVANGTLKYSTGGGTFSDVTPGYSANSNFEFTTYDDRVYFGNGINTPQVYDRATTYGGVVYTAPKTKDMGAQAPGSAPTVGAHTAGGSVPAGAHTYKVTFLYYDVEESNGGPATGVTTVSNPNNTVPLTSVPIGGYGVTARKIYRDDNNGDWRLVGTISDNTTTTFSDTASIGTSQIPTGNSVPPQFRYIITHLDRNWIAGIPGDSSLLAFSDAGLPNIFPVENYILCNPKDPITALYVFNDRIIVFNRNSIGQIIGNTKDTFRYSEIPSSIGCVDNRSIQIRTTVGVPTLIWYSDKGFYSYNGSSVNYISDPIEDLVNLNIQQAQQVKGQNAQTTEAHFNAGVKSPAILTTGGVITVDNPTHTWDDHIDWNTGPTLTNVVSVDGTNTISAPKQFAPTFASGTFANTILSGSNLTLTASASFTGESYATDQTLNVGNNGSARGSNTAGICTDIAQAIIPPRSGTLNTVSLPLRVYSGAGSTIVAKVYADSANQPGAELFSQTFSLPNFGGQGAYTLNFSPSVSLTGGQRYWIGARTFFNTGNTSSFGAVNITNSTWSGGSPSYCRMSQTINSGPYTSWEPLRNSDGASYPAIGVLSGPYSFAGSYTFTPTSITSSGNWKSPIHDTYSNSISTGMTLTASFFSHPSGTSSTVVVNGSNSSDMSTIVSTQTLVNPSGITSLTTSGARYWQISATLATNDNTIVPVINPFVLQFNSTATWISAAIDHTTDVTALSSLPMVATIPAFTSATITIATSADDITYSPFTAIGSATPQRYSKVKIVMTSAFSGTVTSTVTSATLNWVVSANIVSSDIDTGATPAGWDVFQSQFLANGGTVTLYMRSAATQGGLAGATFIAVTNGSFPTTPVFRWVNWKAVITATANNVPTIDSVSINWFISSVNPIRAASIFYNRNYYLAAAEYNQSANNLVIVLDAEGLWRIYRGVSINTLSYFFNELYFGSSTTGKVYKFLQGNTNPIELIIDTKELDLGYPDKTKILRNVRINGNETGAKYYVQFSVDAGNTWIDMIDPYTGLTYLQTSPGGAKFSNKFVPVFLEGQVTAGRSIKFRVKESTSAEVELESLKAEIWIRAGERNG